MSEFLLWAHKAPVVILCCLTKFGPTWIGDRAEGLSKLRERAAQSEGSKVKETTPQVRRPFSFTEV
jgi:hypothetical protein